MRKLLLASTSLLALSASIATASVNSIVSCGPGTTPTTFANTGSLQICTVSTAGDKIEINGGSGGTEPYRVLPNAGGGKGTGISDNFCLIVGALLRSTAGGRGHDGPGADACGAAGDSFVLGPSATPLLIAGDGGESGGDGGSAHLSGNSRRGGAGGMFVGGTFGTFATASGNGDGSAITTKLLGYTASASVPEPATSARPELVIGPPRATRVRAPAAIQTEKLPATARAAPASNRHFG